MELDMELPMGPWGAPMEPLDMLEAPMELPPMPMELPMGPLPMLLVMPPLPPERLDSAPAKLPNPLLPIISNCLATARVRANSITFSPPLDPPPLFWFWFWAGWAGWVD